jgi:hypothetical protein
MSQDNKALVRRLFDEVFTTTNLSAADDIVAEEYMEHAKEPFGREEPGLVQGPSHARDAVAWLREQFPDLEMTIESIVAESDTVAARVRSIGTNLGRRSPGFLVSAPQKRCSGHSLRPCGPDQTERLGEPAGPGIAVARQNPARRQPVKGIE